MIKYTYTYCLRTDEVHMHTHIPWELMVTARGHSVTQGKVHQSFSQCSGHARRVAELTVYRLICYQTCKGSSVHKSSPSTVSFCSASQLGSCTQATRLALHAEEPVGKGTGSLIHMHGYHSHAYTHTDYLTHIHPSQGSADFSHNIIITPSTRESFVPRTQGPIGQLHFRVVCSMWSYSV